MTEVEKDSPAADQATDPERADSPSPETAAPSAGSGAETTTAASDGDWKDRYLRLAAEWDNFRKRSARDFGELIRTAERELIAELTEVLDNLGRALSADHKNQSADDLAKGVALIRDQMWTVLEKRGLERMATVGGAFNPEEHDAMMHMPSEEHPEGMVAQEVSAGYRLGGKVLRHAKVIVSQGKSGENQ